MARTQSRYYPNDEIFRAVVEQVNEDGDVTLTTTYGPYASAATAKGMITNHIGGYLRKKSDYRVRVERSATVWEDTGFRVEGTHE